MRETVYGDLLFLINFSMDFLCFYISAFLLHTKLSLLRGTIASALGGVYAVASLFMNTGQVLSLALDILSCFVMCLIVFYRKGTAVRSVIKACAVYLFVSMLMGGIMTALFSLFNKVKMLSEPYEADEGISVWIFALLAIFGGLFTTFGGRFFRSSSKEKSVDLSFSVYGKEITVKALCDSGNLVSDPISGKAVVVAALSVVYDVIPAEMLPAFEKFGTVEDVPPEMAAKIRMIPSSTVFGNGIMLALKPQSVYVRMRGKKIPKDVLIAFVDTDKFGTYGAIVPEEILI